MVDDNKSRSNPFTPSDHHELKQNYDGYQENSRP